MSKLNRIQKFSFDFEKLVVQFLFHLPMPGKIKTATFNKCFLFKRFVCPVTTDLQTAAFRSWTVETKLFYLCTEPYSCNKSKLGQARVLHEGEVILKSFSNRVFLDITL